MTADFYGLLAAVREDPADDAPRLAAADWMDEHGGDEWAARIRAHVAAGRRGIPVPMSESININRYEDPVWTVRPEIIGWTIMPLGVDR